MGITTIALASKIGYVVIVGATSILANTLIAYHHNYKSKSRKSSSSRGGGDYESKSTSERIKELRKLHSAE